MQEGIRRPAKLLAVSPGWDKPPRKPVIWINGWPGVGKASVAGLLSNLIGADKTVLVAEDANDDTNPTFDPRQDPHGTGIHDHASPRLAEALESQHADEQAARRAVAVSKHILDPASFAKFTIITACQAATEHGAAVAGQYAAAAQQAERLFVPVTLVCEVAENIRRIKTSQAVHPAHHDAALQDPKEAIAERCVGLYEFSQTPGPSMPPSPCFPGSPLEELARGGPENSADMTDGKGPKHVGDEGYGFDDSPDALAICVDVTRKTSMEAGFTILQHVEEMDERRLRRERAAAWAAAEREARRLEMDEELARRAAQRQASYGHAAMNSQMQDGPSDDDSASSLESPDDGEFSDRDCGSGGAHAAWSPSQVVRASSRNPPRRRSA